MGCDIETLKKVYENLAETSYNGIQGVSSFSGKQKGPVVGITICTHGNEPAGLALVAYLGRFLLEKPLLKGTLFIVLNNIQATGAYFTAVDASEKQKARYVDVNMNRLPRNVMELVGDNRYEVKRAQELAPIWSLFDVGLDIHSMTSAAEPMLISRGTFQEGERLVKGFPIGRLISNIDAIQIGAPALSFYGSSMNSAAFSVEAGQHTEQSTFERAICCALSLLGNLGMVAIRPTGPGQYTEYRVEDSVLFPDISFDMTKNFRSYDFVHKGEILAESATGEQIFMPFDGHLIFPTERRGAEKDITEEMAFIARPMKLHTSDCKS